MLMRNVSIACLTVLAFGTFAAAQQTYDNSRLPESSKILDTDAGMPSNRLRDPDQNTRSRPQANAWQPQYRVVLKLTKNGQSKRSVRSYSVPFNVSRERLDGRTRQTVSEISTEVREIQREIFSPGTAVLACDSLNVSMNSTEEGSQTGFEFETKGRARLLLHNYVLDCEAMTFVDGVLTLKSAKSVSDGLKMQATEIRFELDIFGVDSKRFDQPIAALTPESNSLGATYAPLQQDNRRDFARDNDAIDPQETDWSPQDRSTDFSRGDFEADVPEPRHPDNDNDNELGNPRNRDSDRSRREDSLGIGR